MISKEIAIYMRMFYPGGQAEFARNNGWSRSRVNNIVHQKHRNPSIEQKIAEVFNMPTGQVFNGKPLTRRQTLQLLKR